MKRRAFLRTALAASLATVPVFGASNRPRRVVLPSSWQTVNIGDIAHTPGMLALLEKHIPEAEVTLWSAAKAKAAKAREFVQQRQRETMAVLHKAAAVRG